MSGYSVASFRSLCARVRLAYDEDAMLEHGGKVFWSAHRNRVQYFGMRDPGGNRHYAIAVGGIFVGIYGYGASGEFLYVWVWEPMFDEELWVDRMLPHLRGYELVGERHLSDMIAKGEL